MSKLNTAVELIKTDNTIELDAFITAMQAAFADLSNFNATCYFNTANRKLGLARRAKSDKVKAKKIKTKAEKPKDEVEAPVADVVKDIDAIKAKNLETIKKVHAKFRKAKQVDMSMAEEPTVEAADDFEEKEDIDQLLAVIAN